MTARSHCVPTSVRRSNPSAADMGAGSSAWLRADRCHRRLLSRADKPEPSDYATESSGASKPTEHFTGGVERGRVRRSLLLALDTALRREFLPRDPHWL